MNFNIAESKYSFSPVSIWGTSKEADFIAAETDNIISELQTAISIGLGKENIFNKILHIADDCAVAGWDGDNAKPVIDATLMKAASFLKALPLGTEAPTASAEPDGSLSFEWYRSARKLMSISIGRDCFLHYAALIGERKAYGTEPFLGSVPEVIIDLISQVTNG